MRLRVAMGILACAAAAWVGAPRVWAQTAPGATQRDDPAEQKRQQKAVVRVIGAPGSYLGIGVAEVTAERAKALNLKEERGAEVTNVDEDSPAAKAGLKTGDVVLEFNGQAVQGTSQLTRMVRETPAGRQVKLGIWRNGSQQTIAATIGNSKGAWTLNDSGDAWFTMPDIHIPEFKMQMPPMDIPRFQMNAQNPRLGIMGESMGSQQQFGEFLGVKEGVLVKSVTKDSPAERAGIKAGDVIVKVDESKVASTDEITRALRGLKDGKSAVPVVVVRNKKEMTITVTLDRDSRGAVKAALPVVEC
jgi:serine protease Do